MAYPTSRIFQSSSVISTMSHTRIPLHRPTTRFLLLPTRFGISIGPCILLVAATSCRQSCLVTSPFTLRSRVTNTIMAELCSVNSPRMPWCSGAAQNYYIICAPQVRQGRFMAISFTLFVFETARQGQSFGRFKPQSSLNYDRCRISKLLSLLSSPTTTAAVSAPFGVR